jgi:hypothetical protein
MKIRADKICSCARRVGLQRTVDAIPKIEAREGSVLVCKALGENPAYGSVELSTGRMSKVIEGDIIVGVLGERRATKGFFGVVPPHIKVGDRLNILNLGGVIGKAVSGAPDLGRAIELEVLGQVVVFPNFNERTHVAANITDFGIRLATHSGKCAPVIFVSATNMDSGKTTTACEIINGLSAKGYKVGAAKITGVSLMRDTLNMQDYGAELALSFTDAGLVSTTNAKNIARVAEGIIAHLSNEGMDCIVAELGDGVLGGYGVEAILRDKKLMKHAAAHVVCASDPVGAWGLTKLFSDFGLQICAVSGKITDNEVGTGYVEKELGLPAANAITAPKKLVSIVEKKVFG